MESTHGKAQTSKQDLNTRSTGPYAPLLVLSQHNDTSKNTMATSESCYKLHSYVGAMSSYNKFLLEQHLPSRKEDTSSEDAVWLPKCHVIKNGDAYTPLALGNVSVNVHLHIYTGSVGVPQSIPLGCYNNESGVFKIIRVHHCMSMIH